MPLNQARCFSSSASFSPCDSDSMPRALLDCARQTVYTRLGLYAA
jgi:hypothetical protein